MLLRSLARPLAAVPALVLLLGLAGCGDEDSTATDDTSPSAATSPSESDTSGECAYSPDGTNAAVQPPPATPTVSGEVSATVTTSVGDLAMTLDADKAPCTVGSFVSLAEQGYFDGTTCHRMTTDGIYVLQCGDPTGTGSGGPGYSYPDELSGTETYGAGTLAMANAGPDTNGSQFFIVYEESPLPPSYTVFGSVDEATVDLIAGVAADGTTPQVDGAPNTPVDIESVAIG